MSNEPPVNAPTASELKPVPALASTVDAEGQLPTKESLATFAAAAQYVLSKNAELYRRLAQ